MHRLALLLPLLIAGPAQADERRYMLSGFERVRIEGPFIVTVTPGSAGARTTGEPRSLDTVTVRVDGTTLVIAPSVNAWGGYPGAARTVPAVVVTAPSLRAVAVIGGAKVSVARLDGQRVNVSLSGSRTLDGGRIAADRVIATVIGNGAMTLAGRALYGRFQTNGAGTIDAGKLEVGALSVNAQSAGDSTFAARDTADVVALGQGRVTVLGSPACKVAGTAPVVCGKAAP